MQMQEEEGEGDTDTDTALYPVVQADYKAVGQEYTVVIQMDTHLEVVVDIHKVEEGMDMDKENR